MVTRRSTDCTICPTAEDTFWSRNFAMRPYVQEGHSYSDYQPAYRYGWESYGRHAGRNWGETEPELRPLTSELNHLLADLRRRFGEALKHFSEALSLSGPQADIQLRIGNCQTFLPPTPPVVLAPAPVVAYPVCPALPPYPYYCR